MQIAICDDEQKELKVIRTALDTYREAHPEYSFDIDEYSTALDVLHAVDRGKTYDIALLGNLLENALPVASETVKRSARRKKHRHFQYAFRLSEIWRESGI